MVNFYALQVAIRIGYNLYSDFCATVPNPPAPARSFVLVAVSSHRRVCALGDCQQPFVIYHFEFRDSPLSVLIIRRQTRPGAVFSQPPLCNFVSKAMETDGRDENSYLAV